MKKQLCMLFLVIFLFSCGEKDASNRFELECKVDRNIQKDTLSVKADSIALYVYEADYNTLRFMQGVKLKNGAALLQGIIDCPHPAFIKVVGDIVPHYFVLEPCRQTIYITPSSFRLGGGETNRKYFTFLQKYMKMKNEKRQLTRLYKKMFVDSTLTLNAEQRLHRRDSTLSNLMQRMIIDGINANDATSLLIWQQYGNMITADNLKKLNHNLSFRRRIRGE